MSWNNCRKCVFLPRSNFTSAIFKVLLTLKLLHGSRSGIKGSTLEDIAMHMMKYYPLDGDIKSQVLASLKYGVKMHFIQKRKEKFALIIPASSVQLAPCKFKNEEIERINCIFPPVWHSNSCPDSVCGHGDQSCCGRRKRAVPSVCCEESDGEDEAPRGRGAVCDTCAPCKTKRSKSSCKQSARSQDSCECGGPPARKKSKYLAPCPKAKPAVCSRKRGKSTRSKSGFDDDYCHLCAHSNPDDMECDPSYKYEAYKNCSCCNK
ncbi:hypothetical protein Zmor_001926 [Zophobas morio]|uniref:Uncharacterized protein n=1 Tax=Zophobas morio TaxID=2755281 RepID=A0AA38MPP2_9CUCU|nr:hypothetical protein Zmor_001926 [Zophobas morio]